MHDDESVLKFLKNLRNNPPSLRERMKGVNAKKDGQILQNEFT